MAALAQSVAVPVGVIKRFGPFGPEYQVLGAAEPLHGKARIRIALVRTSEEVTYDFDAMLNDPEARLVFAIAFDLDIRSTEAHHPRSVSQAYTDIRVFAEEVRLCLASGKRLRQRQRRSGKSLRYHDSAQSAPLVSSLRKRYSSLSHGTMVGLYTAYQGVRKT